MTPFVKWAKAYDFVVLADGKIWKKELNKQNYQLINLASAPRSTEITLSHGHATSIEEELKGTVVPKTDELKGIMVSILGVNVVEGQYEWSVKGAIVDAFIEVDDN